MSFTPKQCPFHRLKTPDCDGSNSLPLVDVIALGALPVELNLADADFVAFEYPSAKTRLVVCALPGLV